jgi:Na+-transporting NADH:ubiquinone oxidoreductase subunit C
MNTSSNGYVLGFAITVCVAISTMLAITANSLGELQAAAKEFDRQKNVMIAGGLIQEGDGRPRKELEAIYQKQVRTQIVDLQSGDFDAGKTPASVEAIKDPKERARYRPVAVALDADGKETGLILPIQCKGLWGPMFGYLALDRDANHVRGITFYAHKETPGLGGEVDNPQWKEMWKGKTVLGSGDALVGITVKKGKVDVAVPAEKQHYVDGLSGATITSNGVTKGVRAELEAWKPLLNKYWAKKN